jgi:hypothetical protein
MGPLEEKIILLERQRGLRWILEIRTLPRVQRDEFSLFTSKFESDMPSHGVGLYGGISGLPTSVMANLDLLLPP